MGISFYQGKLTLIKAIAHYCKGICPIVGHFSAILKVNAHYSKGIPLYTGEIPPQKGKSYI